MIQYKLICNLLIRNIIKAISIVLSNFGYYVIWERKYILDWEDLEASIYNHSSTQLHLTLIKLTGIYSLNKLWSKKCSGGGIFVHQLIVVTYLKYLCRYNFVVLGKVNIQRNWKYPFWIWTIIKMKYAKTKWYLTEIQNSKSKNVGEKHILFISRDSLYNNAYKLRFGLLLENYF